MMAANEDIRFVTYLSPSIPQPLFAALADHVQRALGHERISLRVDSRASGPQKGANAPPLPKKRTWRSCAHRPSCGCATCNRRTRSCSARCPCSTTKGTKGSPSTSATSWCATTLRSTLSPSSKEARGPTTMVLAERLLQPVEQAGGVGRGRELLR